MNEQNPAHIELQQAIDAAKAAAHRVTELQQSHMRPDRGMRRSLRRDRAGRACVSWPRAPRVGDDERRADRG